MTTQLVDDERLHTFLAAQMPGEMGVAAPFSVRKHEAGYSNETFFIDWGDRHLVMRRPPRGDLLPTSHDVDREFRVLSGLYGTAARVPWPLAASADHAIIGAPFYVMERVDGVVIREALPAALDPTAQRRRIGEEMVDALVELHSVDYQKAGLAALGKPEGYLERQIRRWNGQLELTLPRTRALPGITEVTDWLRSRVPSSPAATIVHGDYKLDNVIFSAHAPAHLEAILDWEMATLGDPLADLGWLMQSWGPSGDAAADALAVTCLPGFLSREKMVARYERRSGRNMGAIQFYLVLALWKLAIILEGLYALYLAGTASNQRSAEMEFRVPRLIERMHRVMRGEL